MRRRRPPIEENVEPERVGDDGSRELRPSHRERQAPGDRSQRLAHRLLSLGASDAAGLPLSDRVREALDDGRAMKAGNAHRRQERRLAQFLRDDDEMQAIEDALQALGGEQVKVARSFQRIEEWRDALVKGSASTDDLAAAIGRSVDDALKGEIARAREEATSGRHRGAGRALFRSLSEIVAADAARPPTA